MSCSKWRWVSSGMETVGALLLLITFFVLRVWSLVSIACAALMLAGIALSAVKCRCPVCRRYLSGRVPLSATRCPFCGASLSEEKAAHK